MTGRRKDTKEPTAAGRIKDRVIEIKKVRGDQLASNDGNWRIHPAVQRQQMMGLLDEIGIAGAMVAYYSKRNGGKLTLIDGHLRTELEPSAEWPVVITDLSDEEADKLLATYDVVTYTAETNERAYRELTESLQKSQGGWIDERQLYRNTCGAKSIILTQVRLFDNLTVTA